MRGLTVSLDLKVNCGAGRSADSCLECPAADGCSGDCQWIKNTKECLGESLFYIFSCYLVLLFALLNIGANYFYFFHYSA